MNRQISQLPGRSNLLWRSLSKRPAPLAADQRLTGQGLEIASWPLDQQQLQAFAEHHGVRPGAMLSAWYALIQPAHLALFALPELPIRAAGTVHTGNRIKRLASADELHELSVARLSVSLLGDTLHRRGRELHVRSELHDDTHCLLSMDSDYFVREALRESLTREPDPDASSEWPQRQTLSLGADFGRRYARVSGDWNPIHLWPWTSRWFGFPRPIAHGVGVMAGIEALRVKAGRPPLQEISVRFLRPVVLPGHYHLLWGDSGFALCGNDEQRLQQGEWRCT